MLLNNNLIKDGVADPTEYIKEPIDTFAQMTKIDPENIQYQTELIQRVKDYESRIPMWMKPATRRMTDSHERFHNEIIDFMEWASIDNCGGQGSPQEQLFSKLKRHINNAFPKAQLMMFGSSAS